MKKLWKKFRHWLIHLLGGYTEPERIIVKHETKYVTTNPVRVSSKSFVSNMLIRHDPEAEQRAIASNIRDLLDQVYEMSTFPHNQLINVRRCDHFENDGVIFESEIMIMPCTEERW